jgi:hypothetical protein
MDTMLKKPTAENVPRVMKLAGRGWMNRTQT